jgi:hypothetical protein
MHTNGLARHYHALTPDERLPLILAASRRGDDQERRRLVDSAPARLYRVPDCFGRMDAFQLCTLLHRCELLEIAGLYVQVCYMADNDILDFAERLSPVASLYGYLYRQMVEGWRRFCDEVHLTPDLYADLLPGRDLLKAADRFAEVWAFTGEEALAHVRKKHPDCADILTAQGVADRWREAYRAAADVWG